MNSDLVDSMDCVCSCLEIRLPDSLERDGKTEEVSGSISWKAMPITRKSENGERDVHAAMFIPGSRDPILGGGAVLDSDFVGRLAQENREVQAALIGMMGWKRREGYEVHCV